MSEGAKPEPSGYALWRQEFPDYKLVAETGEELPCHKAFLSKNSPVFKRMLATDVFKEGKEGKTAIKGFDFDTIKGLLEYIYAETKAKLGYKGHYHYNQPATIIYYRDIDHNRLLTPKLLELAHMFQFEELEQDCIQHLKGHITDANAMEVWAVANLIQSHALKEAVFEKLIHRSHEKLISDVPGVERLIGPNAQELMDYWSAKYPAPCQPRSPTYPPPGGFVFPNPREVRQMKFAFRAPDKNI